MSFVVNVMENDTLKYWKNKLKGKWYRYPFLLTKNLEIDSFMSEYGNNQYSANYDGAKSFLLSDKKNKINESSKLAIIVPIYVANQKAVKQVERLIKSINNLKRKPDFVFLVDDCSPVTYRNFGYKIVKLDHNSGPANARNTGIDMALESGAEIIAFTDSDVVLPTNWTENIIKEFIVNREFQVLSGKTQSFSKTWFDRYHNINGTLNGRQFKNSNQLLYGPTCNLALEAEILKDIRFSLDFSLAAGEDIEFCYRILQRGFNIVHAKEMIVYHDFGYKILHFKRNKQLFIKQFKKYAIGEMVLLRSIPVYYYFLSETHEISE